MFGGTYGGSFGATFGWIFMLLGSIALILLTVWLIKQLMKE